MVFNIFTESDILSNLFSTIAIFSDWFIRNFTFLNIYNFVGIFFFFSIFIYMIMKSKKKEEFGFLRFGFSNPIIKFIFISLAIFVFLYPTKTQFIKPYPTNNEVFKYKVVIPNLLYGKNILKENRYFNAPMIFTFPMQISNVLIYGVYPHTDDMINSDEEYVYESKSGSGSIFGFINLISKNNLGQLNPFERQSKYIEFKNLLANDSDTVKETKNYFKNLHIIYSYYSLGYFEEVMKVKNENLKQEQETVTVDGNSITRPKTQELYNKLTKEKLKDKDYMKNVQTQDFSFLEFIFNEKLKQKYELADEGLTYTDIQNAFNNMISPLGKYKLMADFKDYMDDDDYNEKVDNFSWNLNNEEFDGDIKSEEFYGYLKTMTNSNGFIDGYNEYFSNVFMPEKTDKKESLKNFYINMLNYKKTIIQNKIQKNMQDKEVINNIFQNSLFEYAFEWGTTEGGTSEYDNDLSKCMGTQNKHYDYNEKTGEGLSTGCFSKYLVIDDENQNTLLKLSDTNNYNKPYSVYPINFKSIKSNDYNIWEGNTYEDDKLKLDKNKLLEEYSNKINNKFSFLNNLYTNVLTQTELNFEHNLINNFIKPYTDLLFFETIYLEEESYYNKLLFTNNDIPLTYNTIKNLNTNIEANCFSGSCMENEKVNYFKILTENNEIGLDRIHVFKDDNGNELNGIKKEINKINQIINILKLKKEKQLKLKDELQNIENIDSIKDSERRNQWQNLSEEILSTNLKYSFLINYVDFLNSVGNEFKIETLDQLFKYNRTLAIFNDIVQNDIYKEWNKINTGENQIMMKYEPIKMIYGISQQPLIFHNLSINYKANGISSVKIKSIIDELFLLLNPDTIDEFNNYFGYFKFDETEKKYILQFSESGNLTETEYKTYYTTNQDFLKKQIYLNYKNNSFIFEEKSGIISDNVNNISETIINISSNVFKGIYDIDFYLNKDKDNQMTKIITNKDWLSNMGGFHYNPYMNVIIDQSIKNDLMLYSYNEENIINGNTGNKLNNIDNHGIYNLSIQNMNYQLYMNLLKKNIDKNLIPYGNKDKNINNYNYFSNMNNSILFLIEDKENSLWEENLEKRIIEEYSKLIKASFYGLNIASLFVGGVVVKGITKINKLGKIVYYGKKLKHISVSKIGSLINTSKNSFHIGKILSASAFGLTYLGGKIYDTATYLIKFISYIIFLYILAFLYIVYILFFKFLIPIFYHKLKIVLLPFIELYKYFISLLKGNENYKFSYEIMNKLKTDFIYVILYSLIMMLFIFLLYLILSLSLYYVVYLNNYLFINLELNIFGLILLVFVIISIIFFAFIWKIIDKTYFSNLFKL